MTMPTVPPTRCRRCTALLNRAGEPCVRCAQYSHPSMPGYLKSGPHVQVIQQAVPVKSVAVALLLTFMWLGAGHLYANRAIAGALLLSLNFFLVLVSFTGVGLMVSVPLWVVTFVIAMTTAANAVQDHNLKVFQPRPVAMPF